MEFTPDKQDEFATVAQAEGVSLSVARRLLRVVEGATTTPRFLPWNGRPWRPACGPAACSKCSTRRTGPRSNKPPPMKFFGCNYWIDVPSFPNFAIEPMIFLRHVEVPEGVPLAVEVGGSEVQHRLCPTAATHSGSFDAIFDQMPTRSLDHSTANRITRRRVLVILHPIPIPLEILRRIPHGLPLLSLQTTLGGLGGASPGSPSPLSPPATA